MDLSGFHIYGIGVGGRKERDEYIWSVLGFHCHKAGSNLPISFLVNIQSICKDLQGQNSPGISSSAPLSLA